MPSLSTAELTRPVAVPDDLGQPVWSERRTFPVVAAFGVPAVFLFVGAVALQQVVVRAVLAACGVALVIVAYRRRAKAVIETYTLTERYVGVEQPGGGKAALPVASLTRVVLNGDRVLLEGDGGVVTFGFVRRQRALVRALQQLAPNIAIDTQIGAACRT